MDNKDVKKVSLTLTSPKGRFRTIVGVSINPAQVTPNFALSDQDQEGNVVTIQTGSTATTYEIVVRQNSANFNFLNDFVSDCLDSSQSGTGIYKNTSRRSYPETHVLAGVTVQQKESGQSDTSNVDATFTVQAENVTRQL